MSTIKDVIAHLEGFAPGIYQESYDNAGLLVGHTSMTVTGVLCTLDSTEAVVDEALAKNCNLIVAHHPIVFKGLKSLTGRNYIERTLIKAIKNDIAIYASHTNLDNMQQGVNAKIAEKLGLTDTQILIPTQRNILKLSVYVPNADAQKLSTALHAAGAGQIGKYSDCHFATEGQGQYKANEGAKPALGQVGEIHYERETKIEVVFQKHLQSAVLAAMKATHPYEEIAHEISVLENTTNAIGTGLVGHLAQPISLEQFLKFVKENLNCGVIKHTADLQKPISKVALVGGSGSFALGAAIGAEADVFLTADYKYHEYFDADGKIVIVDVGHYESEQYTKDLFVEILSKKFTNFAVHLSEVRTNPVFYY